MYMRKLSSHALLCACVHVCLSLSLSPPFSLSSIPLGQLVLTAANAPSRPIPPRLRSLVHALHSHPAPLSCCLFVCLFVCRVYVLARPARRPVDWCWKGCAPSLGQASLCRLSAACLRSTSPAHSAKVLTERGRGEHCEVVDGEVVERERERERVCVCVCVNVCVCVCVRACVHTLNSYPSPHSRAHPSGGADQVQLASMPEMITSSRLERGSRTIMRRCWRLCG